MTERTDESRTLSGIPVDREHGTTPGAVWKLRNELRNAADKLCLVNERIEAIERATEAAGAEREIWRDACDELMHAIDKLGGELR